MPSVPLGVYEEGFGRRFFGLFYQAIVLCSLIVQWLKHSLVPHSSVRSLFLCGQPFTQAEAEPSWWGYF